MLSKLPSDTSIEALFDLEMADQSEAPQADEWNKIKCRKCGGTGKFTGYTGKIIGNCFACKGAGFHMRDADEPDTSAGIDVSKIATAFDKARANKVARPKLRLDTFVFSASPLTGKNPGAIYVKEGERYFGKVTDGRFHPSRDCDDAIKARVVAVAADPATSAKAYGLRLGVCSCCGRTLTNGVSIDLGIGPICAEKYGW